MAPPSQLPLVPTVVGGAPGGWEDRELLYLDLGAFARHLIALLQTDATEELPAVFDVVERLHVEGAPDVQEATTIGLLECIQIHAGHAGLDADRFLPFIGPELREWWKQLDAFWRGKIRYVGETYALSGGDAEPTAG